MCVLSAIVYGLGCFKCFRKLLTVLLLCFFVVVFLSLSLSVSHTIIQWYLYCCAFYCRCWRIREEYNCEADEVSAQTHLYYILQPFYLLLRIGTLTKSGRPWFKLNITQGFWLAWKNVSLSLCVVISVRLPSQMAKCLGSQKLLMLQYLRHHKCEKLCQTLHVAH